MKICLILALSLLSLANAKTQWSQLSSYSFEDYVKEFKKHYSSSELIVRKQIFNTRLDQIRQHNEDSTKSWKMGLNHMVDWSEQELKQLRGVKKGLARRQEPTFDFNQVDTKALPTHVDWRTKGIITPVKDQGQCGSCWSFGTTETIESYFALSTGLLEDLSEQQILDCTPNPNDCGGSGGCLGGTAELAYAQIIKMGGLTTEWMYSYVSYFGTNFACHANSTEPVVQLSGYQVLPSNQYSPVLTALATVGPLVINVDASAWSFYESGVFDGCNQKNPDIDHVVQLVGYGTDPSYGDYWLVRNSWSAGWGEKGYIRLKRRSTPECGIDLTPSDGTGCNGGPSSVKVCGICGLLYDVSYPVIKM